MGINNIVTFQFFVNQFIYNIGQLNYIAGSSDQQHLKHTIIKAHILAHNPLKPADRIRIGNHATDKFPLRMHPPSLCRAQKRNILPLFFLRRALLLRLHIPFILTCLSFYLPFFHFRHILPHGKILHKKLVILHLNQTAHPAQKIGYTPQNIFHILGRIIRNIRKQPESSGIDKSIPADFPHIRRHRVTEGSKLGCLYRVLRYF